MRECWQALKNLSYGVYVVSAISGEATDSDGTRRMNAMTVRMMTQVSTRPPRVALAIAKNRLTHDFICDSRQFAVSVLAQGQEMLAGHFGLRSGRNANKLLEVEYFTAQTGAPILRDCCAFFECRLEAAHDMGNCTLFVGELINGGTSKSGFPENCRPGNAPLLYREDDYFS